MPNEMTFHATITQMNPAEGLLAYADVKVGELLTIRNVKVKQDDYGYVVTVPRTKMPNSDQYKDSLYFADKSMKEAFDKAVSDAYQNRLEMREIRTFPPDECWEDFEEEPGMGMEPSQC